MRVDRRWTGLRSPRLWRQGSSSGMHTCLQVCSVLPTQCILKFGASSCMAFILKVARWLGRLGLYKKFWHRANTCAVSRLIYVCRNIFTLFLVRRTDLFSDMPQE